MALAEEIDDELIKLTENLLDSLNLQLPAHTGEDYSFLRNDVFYVEIFKVVMDHSPHPFNEADFDRETKGMSPGERIQALINLLSRDIVQVDLEHIKGEKIAKGDKKHISNMLQLLEALWQNFNLNPLDGEEDGEEEQKIESDLNRHESFSQERELNKGVSDHHGRDLKETEHVEKEKVQMFNKMMQDAKLQPPPQNGGTAGIPVYNEDPINYNQIQLQPKYNRTKSGKRVGGSGNTATNYMPNQSQGLRKSRPKTANIKSKKREVVKIIEDNVYGEKRYRNLKKRTLVKDQLANVTPGVVREFNKLKREGDNLDYDPMLLDKNIETLREYLDAKKQDNNVTEAVRRQKKQYRQELQDFIAFSKKVAKSLIYRTRP
jgi:hypothetical protein